MSLVTTGSGRGNAGGRLGRMALSTSTIDIRDPRRHRRRVPGVPRRRAAATPACSSTWTPSARGAARGDGRPDRRGGVRRRWSRPRVLPAGPGAADRHLPDLMDPETRGAAVRGDSARGWPSSPRSGAMRDADAYLDFLRRPRPGRRRPDRGHRLLHGRRARAAHRRGRVPSGSPRPPPSTRPGSPPTPRTARTCWPTEIRPRCTSASADQDQGMPAEQQERLDRALTEAGVDPHLRAVRRAGARLHDGRHRGRTTRPRPSGTGRRCSLLARNL